MLANVQARKKLALPSKSPFEYGIIDMDEVAV